MIKAEGIKDGKTMIVEYNRGEFRYDGIEGSYDLEMEIMLDAKHPVGGTYVPTSKYDPLNIINVLGNYFFDKPTLDIETDEDAELPFESEIIY